MAAYFHPLVLAILTLCSAKEAQRSLPCPDPQDILPCVCSVDENYKMDLDCSLIESEDQLAQVFSAYLPFPTFRELILSGNTNLRVIREGDLGPASFEILSIDGGALEEVENGAFSGSYSTATRLDLDDNNLSRFPFEEVSLFTSLNYLWMNANSFQSFPELGSDTLRSVEFGRNILQKIPWYGFVGIKNVNVIILADNNLQEIIEGTFSDLDHLYHLDLSNNHLNNISESALVLSGTRDSEIYLHKNNISSIAVGGVAGLGAGYLSLHSNLLTVLDEGVFRPLLEGGATITLHDNPLDCSCDVAWLITNATLLGLVSTGTSCYDGELLTDLDPNMYEELCY